MDDRDIRDRQTVGRNIKIWRKTNRVRQAELALLVGISQAHVSSIERGQKAVGLRALRRFADATGMSIADLTSARG